MNMVMKTVNSVRWLGAVGLGVVTACGMVYDFFEKENFWNSLWWAVVTATTVGYGDEYPVTVGGRIAGMVLVLFTVLFVIPLITAQFASKLIVNRDAWTHTEQEVLKNQVNDMHRVIFPYGVKR